MIMSERENAFLKMIKRVNWTFLLVQVIILIFYIGYTYARVNTIESVQAEAKTEREMISNTMINKADKSEVLEMKRENQENIKEIKSDLRDIRNILMRMDKSR
jgi:Tfp pilus assembly protein PilO